MRPVLTPAVLRAVAAVSAVAVLVSACSGSGGGSPFGSSPIATADSSTATGSTAVAPGTTNPSAAAPKSAAGSVPAPSPSAAACAPGAITVAGAPFCYPLPTGFTDFSRLTTYATKWTYRTLVSVGRQDLIEVLGAPTDATDQLSDSELLARQYRPYYQLKPGALEIKQAGGIQALQVNGARAFRQLAVYDNGVRTDATTVFFGRFVVSVQCQSKAQTTRVADACAAVRATLQLAR